MKHLYKRLTAILAAVMALTSCMDEKIGTDSGMTGPVTLTGYMDAPSRTVLDGNLSKWMGEEWIQVVGRNGSYWFSSYAGEASTSALFTYDGGNGEYRENDIFAVYPAGSTRYGKDFEGMSISGVTVPSVQNAVAGSYDPEAALAVAYSSSNSLMFKNVTSLLKFTMGSGGIKNVTIWGEMSDVEGGNLPDYVQEGNIYLTISSSWKSDGARFAAYFWNSGGNRWVDMTSVAGQTNLYTCTPPEGYGNVIFCRMNGGSTSNGWSNVWNQTVDLKTSDGNHFTIDNPWNSSYDNKATGSWSAFSATTKAGITGTGTVYYNDGAPVLKGASTGYVSLNGEFEMGQTYYIAVAPVTFEKGMTVEFSRTGDRDKFEVKSTSKKVEFKRNTIYDLGVLTVPISTSGMPEGLQHGINYLDNSTVALVLYDRDNKGKRHDFCNLLWDDNWWGYEGKEKMPLQYDDESGCWWITLTGLDPDRQYKFQYQLGYGDNVTVTTFDPYTEILYDRSNDEWISSSTYPGLAEEYGDTHSGRDNGFVSAFKINKDIYDWKIADYDIPDKNDMVIYELLVRDFTDNSKGEGSIRAALGQLEYLKTLGVTAVELMPVQEFDGNDSWGYGSHAYFAMDKAYGTRNDYKEFIDACHRNGMAVLLDVAYNHATGVHPYAALYWDSTSNKTASNNPWFNVDAPHQWSVYHDWNHSNPMVREHVKRSLTYLMTEYKIDGFRFDLTKGFTQNSGTEGSYDQSRVDILKEYNAHILSVDEDAVMICEHFCDDENWELGTAGIKVWRNMNHPYCKAMKRDMSQADFTGTTNTFDGSSGMMGDWQHFGQYVGYQESHDEQRTNFEGQWDYSGNSIPFATRMERAKLNAAFFLLSPGPKMIWQFGEIGYDISIEDNGGRVNKKPCKTAEYMKVPERKALYDTYAMLLKFRKDNPRFFDYDVNFRWYVGGYEQTGRYMFARSGEGKHFALFGNFGSGSQTISVQLPEGVSEWYQYDNSKAVWRGSNHVPTMAEGQFYLLVSDKSMCR